MKKRFTLLMGLAAGCILAACSPAGTSSSSGSSSDSGSSEPSSSEPSSSEVPPSSSEVTPSSSEEASSSSIEDSSEPASSSAEPYSVPTELADFASLSTRIAAIKAAKVYGYTYSSKSSYSDEVYTYSLNTQEFLTETIDKNYPEYSSTEYVGYDATHYYSVDTSSNSRSQTIGEGEGYDLTAAEAAATFADEIYYYQTLSFDFSDYGVGAPFVSGIEFATNSYEVTEHEQGHQVKFTGYYYNYSYYYYDYSIIFDEDLNMVSLDGSSYNSYDESLWDETTHTYKDLSSESVYVYTYGFKDIHYGDLPAYDAENPLFDVKPYYITEAVVSDTFFGTEAPKTGDAFAFSVDNVTYSPSTALDFGTLVITSVSDESMILLNGNRKGGTFIKAGTVTITYGTPYAGKLGDLTVTVGQGAVVPVYTGLYAEDGTKIDGTSITLAAGDNEPNYYFYGRVANSSGGVIEALVSGYANYFVEPEGGYLYVNYVGAEVQSDGNYAVKYYLSPQWATAGDYTVTVKDGAGTSFTISVTVTAAAAEA